MDRAPSRRFATRVAAACVAALSMCLAFAAGPALAVTLTPTLIAPTASSSHNSPLSVEYELPEAGSSGEVVFVPATGPEVVLGLTSPALAAGRHHFFLNLSSLASETANVASASKTSVADGEYTVVLRYSDLAADPDASASAAKVRIKTVTGAPGLSEPSNGQTFRKAFTVAYTLPEAALSNSVKLTLVGTHAERVLTLANTAAGSHTAEVIPADPALGAGVSSGPSERMPAESYAVVLSYQDVLGNPGASAFVTAVGIAYPLCKAGSYGTGGEEPCANSPKGYFVEAVGANHAVECAPGRYAAEEGLTECLPAQPGSYVPAAGARAELECERGSYADEAGQASCKSATAGHYAPKGSLLQFACVAGTHNPHANAPSSEYCEADAPGSYSAEGAALATPCEAGRYAPGSSSVVCRPADAGSYAEGTGASAEKACPPGTFAAVTGSPSCTETPAGTYATGGATEATPCPAGTTSAAGASACGPPSVAPGPETTHQTGPGAPPVKPAPLVAAPITVQLLAAKHPASLARSKRQRVRLTCSASGTVTLRVSAVLSAGTKRVSITAGTLAVDCLAGRATEAALHFKLSAAAAKLLHAHRASVKLAVRVYLTGASAGVLAGSASLRGQA